MTIRLIVHLLQGFKGYCIEKGQSDDYRHPIWWKLVALFDRLTLKFL